MKHIKYFTENYDYSNLISELDKFLNSSIRNQYIGDENISIYIRKSKRSIDGKLIDFLDIANISIDEKIQGKKVFTNLIQTIISKYPNTNIFVESILNPAVETVLNKFSFKRKSGPDNNMYLLR
jgi:hypothetical protein